MLIEPGGLVFVDARGEDFRFPRACGRFEAFELREHRGQRVRALHARFGRHALPLEQEAQEVPRLHGLDFRAQALHGVAMDAREQAALAPLFFRGARREAAAHREAFGLKSGERGVDLRGRHAERVGERARP